MSSIQLNAIRDILENHRGKRNQISAGEIGKSIEIYEDATHVKTRSLIREAIEVFGIPVAASHRGYYMIENEAELKEYCYNIEKRIAKMNRRKELIEKNYYNYY